MLSLTICCCCFKWMRGGILNEHISFTVLLGIILGAFLEKLKPHETAKITIWIEMWMRSRWSRSMRWIRLGVLAKAAAQKLMSPLLLSASRPIRGSFAFWCSIAVCMLVWLMLVTPSIFFTESSSLPMRSAAVRSSHLWLLDFVFAQPSYFCNLVNGFESPCNCVQYQKVVETCICSKGHI